MGKRSNNLKSMAEHEYGEKPFFVHHRSGEPFIDAFVVEFGFLTGAVDAAEVPSSFEAGGDDAGGNIAVLEKMDCRPDEKAVEEEGGEGRLVLAEIEIAGARNESV